MMKIPFAVTVLILAAAVVIGWQDEHRMKSARERHAKLVADAARLGISIDHLDASDPILVTKRERRNGELDGRKLAADFIAFGKDMDAGKSGGEPDAALEKILNRFATGLMSLDAAGLKIFMAEFRAAQGLNDETRQQLVTILLVMPLRDRPQSALALFNEASDLFRDGIGRQVGAQVVPSSLALWSKDDPLAAIEWVRKNGAKFPDLITEETKRGILSGAATRDPGLAFKLIGELGFKVPPSAVYGIVRAAKTPEERTATLDAMRKHLPTLVDEKTRNDFARVVVGELVRGVAREGCEAAGKWIASARLTPVELENFASGLTPSLTKDETGPWVEWLGSTLPAGKSDDKVRELVRHWTENDYPAAGKWLAATPDGPVKNISIQAYAETVSKYDPETAAKWAMTLPSGREREDVLERIRENSPRNP